MPSRILFTSDLQARRELYTELVRWAERLRPVLVVFGGDLFAGDPATQTRFARSTFLETLGRLGDAGVEAIGIVPGNDDWAVALDVLRERTTPDFVHWLADRPLEIGPEIHVVGYPFVPLTPYCAKDHERLDHFRPTKSDVLDGVATGFGTRGGTPAGVTLPTDGSESIEMDLLALAPQVRRGQSVFVAHCPPRNTGLDLAYGRHTGSHALRAFLEASEPALSLHGHVTEVEHRGGAFAEYVGATLAVNPGQGSALHAVWFEDSRPTETLEHTVLGPWQPAPARVATGADWPALGA
jgi:Icc-related predicted phosphoesterase